MRRLGALAFVSLLALVHPGRAHDSWISRNGLKNPATQEWCCGRGDCGIVMPTPKPTDAGWAIHGDEIIDINGRRIRVDEVVPYNQVSPSPDGYFWRCHTVESKNYDVHGHADYVDGKRRCFFAPPGVMPRWSVKVASHNFGRKARGERPLGLLLSLVTSFASCSIAWAQSYPTRPITIIVPAAAGGPTDTITRILAQRMSVALGQTLVMENNGAAGGSIAVGRAVRAAADGYTLSIGQVGTHVFNGAIYSLGYDVLKDFAPIALVASNPQLIDAREDFPANDLKELLAWLKANPDKALQGTAGAGSPAHIVGSYFQRVTGAAFRFVPYRGAAPAMQALVGPPDRSHVRPGRQFVAAGEGRSHQAFAVTAKTRLAAGPEIPTVDEAGLPGFYTAIWHGLWAPKGTAADVIAVLNGAVREALADRMVQRRLAELGQELPPGDQQTPEALGALQKAEIDKWWPIIKSAGIKAE